MTPSHHLLVEKAKRSLQVAKDSFDDGHYEFVASRAYYSMFYLAQAFLLTKGLTFSKHSAVISAFAVQFTKPDIVPQKYHRYLNDAQEDRHIADYDIQILLTQEDAQEQIIRAEEFLEYAERFLSGK